MGLMRHQVGASSSFSDTGVGQTVNQLENFQSLLNAAPNRSSLLHPLTRSSAMPQSAKFGVPAGGRPPGPNGFRPPAALVPSHNLYSVVISPTEMAAYEASNFKNVKGVYKNCRGIWAAQWTDERGQRHTKYFNPKYYSTESVSAIV